MISLDLNKRQRNKERHYTNVWIKHRQSENKPNISIDGPIKIAKTKFKLPKFDQPKQNRPKITADQVRQL